MGSFLVRLFGYNTKTGQGHWLVSAGVGMHPADHSAAGHGVKKVRHVLATMDASYLCLLPTRMPHKRHGTGSTIFRGPWSGISAANCRRASARSTASTTHERPSTGPCSPSCISAMTYRWSKRLLSMLPFLL